MAIKLKLTRETLPEYARRIFELRGAAPQGEFARKLDVSVMAVSNWERGANEPGVDALLKLANMGDPDSHGFFLDMARQKSGLTGDAIRSISDSVSNKGRAVPTLVKSKTPFVQVPLVAGFAGAGPGYVHESAQVEGRVSIPKDICPNPTETTCIRVGGDSMEPTITMGALAAIDRSQRRPDRLEGKIVAARHEVEGLVFKRMAKSGGKHLLLSDNPLHGPLDIAAGWEIVGRVIWWIQTA